MDIIKAVAMARSELKACGESLIRAAESCDTPEELVTLNAYIQTAKQALQNVGFVVGEAIQERGKSS